MTVEQQQETINSFNKLISNTAKYQILDDEDDIACAIINYFNATSKLTIDAKEVIIEFVCTDYMDNFNEKNKPDSLSEAKEKFKNDATFAAEVLSVYIDKYFYNDLVINRLNNLFLNYSDESYANETNVASILYIVIMQSSYFTNDEKNLVLKHIIKECQDDLKRREKSGEALDYSDDLINLLINEEDNLSEYFADDKDALIQLIDYYFKAYILEDFQLIKFENICDSIISDYTKMPSEKNFSKIYEAIIELDSRFNYKDTILNIIATVNNNDNDLDGLYQSTYYEDEEYDIFVSDESYGTEIIKQYLKQTMLDIDEARVELINEIIRDSLKTLVSPQKTIDENVGVIVHHFANSNYGRKADDQSCQKYGIEIQEFMLYQKICLISDYYNRFSDEPLNTVISNHIYFIKNMDRKQILNYFNYDQYLARFCVESFVEETLGVNCESHGICKDIDTIKKINPFYILEKTNNTSYQKKK